ncbi:MAG: hypothetical protein ACI4BI_01435, partial [Anaerotardibacter sp.]
KTTDVQGELTTLKTIHITIVILGDKIALRPITLHPLKTPIHADNHPPKKVLFLTVLLPETPLLTGAHTERLLVNMTHRVQVK